MSATAHTSFRTSAETRSVLDAVREISTRERDAQWRSIDDRGVAFRTRRTLLARPLQVRVVAAQLGEGSDVRIVLEGRTGLATRSSAIRRAADRLSARIQRALCQA